MANQFVVCLMGPTASGKTAVAMRLADMHPFDLVSVDSALVYRGMDIGTAKPDADELRKYPHHLVNIRDPEETYSAGDFVRDANLQIDASHAAGRVPLLVGGTMMYFRSLIEGIACLPAAEPTVRARIDQEAAIQGWPEKHAELAQIDASSAMKINPNDSQRIQRALEVYALSGRTLSDWQSATEPGKHRYLRFALIPEPRAELHARIDVRLQKMLECGFIDELKTLMKRPDLTEKHASMRALGYRQIWSHLEGKLSFDEARTMTLAATRQLAKRQLTWLRSDVKIQTINPLESDAHVAIWRQLRGHVSAA